DPRATMPPSSSVRRTAEPAEPAAEPAAAPTAEPGGRPTAEARGAAPAPGAARPATGPARPDALAGSTRALVRLGLPKGALEAGVHRLLADAGIGVQAAARGYRPVLSLPGFTAKLVKPQNIVEMLHLGRRDLGFAGRDWVEELSADVVE